MKAAIIGYGKMGREIEKILIERGHEVVKKIDMENSADISAEGLAGVDVAIEFTTPDTAFGNICATLRAGVPIVSGTTGWTERMAEVVALCKECDGSFFYSSNYSLGVNILFKINKVLGAMMKPHTEYKLHIEETHHIHKKDAPSGTAKTLADDLRDVLYDGDTAKEIEIQSFREGEVPGIHNVVWESENDILTLQHSLHSRRALAFGAVLAAEYAATHKGILTMDNLLSL